MKAPPRLQILVDEGLIDTVVRQLMSGKEAMVYVVRSGDDTRCAKIYKEATQRSFRQAVDYTENRKVKNTRQARAMAKGTRFGRECSVASVGGSNTMKVEVSRASSAFAASRRSSEKTKVASATFRSR